MFPFPVQMNIHTLEIVKTCLGFLFRIIAKLNIQFCHYSKKKTGQAFQISEKMNTKFLEIVKTCPSFIFRIMAKFNIQISTYFKKKNLGKF